MSKLIADVIAAPDHDGPRLAYAAAISTQHAERSRFIELQLRSAVAERDPNALPQPSLKYGADDLLRTYGFTWAAGLCPPCTAIYYDRGFVEHVCISMQDFLRHGAALLAQAPIRHLDLTWSPGVTRQLFESPLLSTIRSLNLDRCSLGDEEMRWLAASPYLGNLEWLELLRNNVGMDGVRALAASALLPRLRYVGFFGNPADPTEELFFDQGYVIDRGLPEQGRIIEAEFGPVDWLHLDAATSWDVPPRRY